MIAITTVRDEADIIEHTVGHLIAQGARVIVADNLSTDCTALAAAFAGAEIIYDPDPAHRQAEKMSALAAQYAKVGEWVIPFDGDEEWSGLANLTDDYDVAIARPVVQLPDGDGWRGGWVEPHPKVAFRWCAGARLEEGNHGVSGVGSRTLEGALTVKHFQYRNLEQVKRKVRQGAAALDAGAIPETVGTHWRELARLTDAELEQWWADYCRRSPR